MENLEFSEINNNCIFAIADGMGGYAKGDLASKLVLEVILNNINNLNNEDDIINTIKKAQSCLINYAVNNIDFSGFGTTLTGILIIHSRGYIFNVGDSRTYKLNSGYLSKLTKDHSLVQNLFDEGVISEDEMRTNSQKNIVTSAIIGKKESYVLDIFTKSINIKTDNIFFLCSDGVWETLCLDSIEKSFQEKSLQNTCSSLINQLNENKANDNVSFIILKVKE